MQTDLVARHTGAKSAGTGYSAAAHSWMAVWLQSLHGISHGRLHLLEGGCKLHRCRYLLHIVAMTGTPKVVATLRVCKHVLL